MTDSQVPEDPKVVPLRTAAQLRKQELEDATREVAEALDGALPEGLEFALFVWRTDDRSIKYISTGEIGIVFSIVDRWKAKILGQPQRLTEDPELTPGRAGAGLSASPAAPSVDGSRTEAPTAEQ